jgi:hypothetical protein
MTYDDLMRDSGQIFYAVGDIFISLGKEFVQVSRSAHIQYITKFGAVAEGVRASVSPLGGPFVPEFEND